MTQIRPINLEGKLIWLLFVAVLLLAPQFFTSNFSLAIISQIGIVIMSCLSFNL